MPYRYRWTQQACLTVAQLAAELSCEEIQGRDALLRVFDGETQYGRGAPRPYQVRFLGQMEFFHNFLSREEDPRELLPRDPELTEIQAPSLPF